MNKEYSISILPKAAKFSKKLKKKVEQAKNNVAKFEAQAKNNLVHLGHLVEDLLDDGSEKEAKDGKKILGHSATIVAEGNNSSKHSLPAIKPSENRAAEDSLPAQMYAEAKAKVREYVKEFPAVDEEAEDSLPSKMLASAKNKTAGFLAKLPAVDEVTSSPVAKGAKNQINPNNTIVNNTQKLKNVAKGNISLEELQSKFSNKGFSYLVLPEGAKKDLYSTISLYLEKIENNPVTVGELLRMVANTPSPEGGSKDEMNLTGSMDSARKMKDSAAIISLMQALQRPIYIFNNNAKCRLIGELDPEYLSKTPIYLHHSKNGQYNCLLKNTPKPHDSNRI